MHLTTSPRSTALALAVGLAVALTACQSSPRSNDPSLESPDATSAAANPTPPPTPPPPQNPEPEPTAPAEAPSAGGSATVPPPATPQTTDAATPVAITSQDTTAPGPPPPGGPAISGNFEPAQMQQAVRNFADQYRQTVASACDYIIADAHTDVELRRRAQALKINGSTAIYDIAIDPVPASAMLNAAVTVSLQANLLRTKGPTYFGDYNPMMLQKAEFLQEEIFRVCARVMPDDKRVTLLKLINQWSAENPDVTDFWYVRLTDLPGVQKGLSVTDMVGSLTNLPSKFLNVFNPFSKGQDSVAEAQALAERMSWLAPRLMILAQWRAEAVVYDTIANTRLPEALKLGNRFAVVAESLPDTLNQQREALFADLQQNQDALNGLLNNTQSLATEADTLFSTVDQIMAKVQALQENAIAASADDPPKDPNAPPSRPFDITEYTAALVELNQVVTDANELFTNVDTAATPEALDARLNVVEATLRNLILIAAIATLAVGLLLILAVKFIPSRRRG